MSSNIHIRSKSVFILSLMAFLMFLLFACGENENEGVVLDGDLQESDGDLDGESALEEESDLEVQHKPDIPEDIPKPPEALPFVMEREQKGEALSDGEISDFTDTMKNFYEDVPYYTWVERHTYGLAEDNEWNQPPYRVWWTHGMAKKEGDTVTYYTDGMPDNPTAKMGRVLTPILGSYLSQGDELTRRLAVGLISGLSATMDGMVWGHEDPPIDTIMARGIFHRTHSYEADGGRKAIADYEGRRQEVTERRHDTVHNPDNPTWGDIYVRNKRSKDDFPYVYRMIPFVLRTIYETEDEQLRSTCIKFFRQMRALTKDFIANDYRIRTKVTDGEIIIPMNGEVVDDFASFTVYEDIFPNAECNAKICTAYLAEGSALDNVCDDGISEGYENMAIAIHYWSSNMIWGFHVAAIANALAFEDYDTYRELLEGYRLRMESMMVDERAEDNPEWYPDLAQLLVLGAAYGLPLNEEEARLVAEQFAAGVEHYNKFKLWDLWDSSVSDGEYEYIPDRNDYEAEDNVSKTYVRIPEIVNLYEYCASPWKNTTGVEFIDCDKLLGEVE